MLGSFCHISTPLTLQRSPAIGRIQFRWGDEMTNEVRWMSASCKDRLKRSRTMRSHIGSIATVRPSACWSLDSTPLTVLLTYRGTSEMTSSLLNLAQLLWSPAPHPRFENHFYTVCAWTHCYCATALSCFMSSSCTGRQWGEVLSSPQ